MLKLLQKLSYAHNSAFTDQIFKKVSEVGPRIPRSFWGSSRSNSLHRALQLLS